MSALLSFLTLEFVRLFWALLPFPSMWFSGGLPEYRFPEKPAVLTVKNLDGSQGVERIDMQTLLKTRCQSLFSSFRPLWWLFKYVSTLSATADRNCLPVATYRRSIASLETLANGTTSSTLGMAPLTLLN